MSSDLQGNCHLPRGWATTTVGELVASEPNAITDGPFGSNLKSEHYTRSGPRVVRLQNIGSGVFRDDIACISVEHYERLRKHAVFPGDLVIAAFGNPAPRACIVPDIGPAIVKADCIRFRPTAHVLTPFLLYALNSPDVQETTTKRIHGVGRPRINLTEVREIILPLAPLTEQRRIVAEIEKQLTRLDAAVAALKRVQANLKRYRAAVLKAACEGRLVPTEAELARREGRPYETGEQLLARILQERRAKWEADQLAKMLAAGKPARDDSWRRKYKEPEPPDTSHLPVLPAGWAWASVDQLSWFIRNGISTKPNESGDLPILRISAVRPMKVDLEDARYLPLSAEYLEYELQSGDLLFTRYNGTRDLVGVCGQFPSGADRYVHPDKLIRVRLNLESPLPSFVCIAANVGASRAFVEGLIRTTAGQSGVSGADIRRIPIPLPPLSEQARIVTAVEIRFETLDVTAQSVQQELTRADRLRQSILKRAFEGKLVPQDSNDEPASVLLERIRAERAAHLSSGGKSRAERRQTKEAAATGAK